MMKATTMTAMTSHYSAMADPHIPCGNGACRADRQAAHPGYCQKYLHSGNADVPAGGSIL
jgi:hypothetical protein